VGSTQRQVTAEPINPLTSTNYLEDLHDSRVILDFLGAHNSISPKLNSIGLSVFTQQFTRACRHTYDVTCDMYAAEVRIYASRAVDAV